MGYQALLFCADENTARLVTQVLNELEFSVEPANEPFAAVKRLTTQHFDAVVVDCDNEQNAALLFKSARNSGPNKTSLAVAVVEGQAGIAKAFRIGANLVLTKPINVEQSKGTLRVARGLLKKGEAAAKSAPAPVVSQPQAARPVPSNPAFARPLTPMPPATRPIVPPKSITTPHAPLVNPEAASTLELEADPIAQPEPEDAALLESLPEPQVPLPPTSSLHKTAPWAPVKSSSGAAAGVAPARKVTQMPHPGPTQSKVPAAFMPPATEQAPRSKTAVQPVESHTSAAAPVTRAQSTESGGSKKGLIIAAVVLIAAAGGYFGWTKYQATTARPAQTEPTQSSTQGVPVSNASVPASVPSTTVVAPQQIPVASAPQPYREESVPEQEVITRRLTPDAKPVPSTTEQPHEAIVVKGSTAKPLALEAAPQAIPVIGMTSNSEDKAIAGIMQTSAPTPVLKTMRISQGVSQGLIIKKISPDYPAQARQLRIEGAVQLEATISKEGKVSNVKVLGGHPILARAASEAVKQWKYKPYLLNDQPVEIDTQITVNFKLP